MRQAITLSKSIIDHLVVAAASLEKGVKYIEQCLGVTPQTGGKHAKMGTHNALLKLGDKIYLEVIATDPETAPPNRPRWFNLDNTEAYDTPHLITWIVRTDNIYTASKASNIHYGNIELMSRGNLKWLLTIPEDGNLLHDGIAPLLIEWNSGIHPCDQLDDKGCKLLKLEAFHKEVETINKMLASINFEGPVTVKEISGEEPPHLVAHIQAPVGIHTLV